MMRILNSLSHSAILREKLQSYQKSDGVSALAPLNWCKTRWNSLLDAISRFLTIYPQLQKTIIDHNAKSQVIWGESLYLFVNLIYQVYVNIKFDKKKACVVVKPLYCRFKAPKPPTPHLLLPARNLPTADAYYCTIIYIQQTPTIAWKD